MRPALSHLRTILRSRRRLFVAGLAVVYATTAIGVPLPMVASTTKSGELFPCANCACGCATAEQCWRSCCCHSLSERIAWAHEHNVRPPEYALAAAQAAGLDLAWLRVKSQGRTVAASSCETEHGHVVAATTAKPLPACCQKRLEIAATACQQSQHCCCQKTNCSAAAKAPSPYPPSATADLRPKGEDFKRLEGEGSKTSDRLVAWRAMECHGQSMNWLAATPTLVMDRPNFSHILPLVAWLGPAASETATCVAERPDLPPPEMA